MSVEDVNQIMEEVEQGAKTKYQENVETLSYHEAFSQLIRRLIVHFGPEKTCYHLIMLGYECIMRDSYKEARWYINKAVDVMEGIEDPVEKVKVVEKIGLVSSFMEDQ